MGLFSEKKPYTAISSETESLLNHGGPSADPARLLNLIELIHGTRPSDAGGQECGRLLRKRIKYGSPSEQSSALSLLETLVDNGVKTGPLINFSGLGEQLTTFAHSSTHGKTDNSKAARAVRQARVLLVDWSTRRDRNINSLSSHAGLAAKSESRRNRNSFHPDEDLDDVVFGSDEDATARSRSHSRGHSRNLSGSVRSHSRGAQTPLSPSGHARNGSRGRSSGAGAHTSRSRTPSPINLRGASIDTTIATAHNIATRLTNALIESPNGSKETETYYKQAKQLRHRIIKLVHTPQTDVQAFIGQLLAANEELVASLQAHDAVVKDHEELEAQEDHDLLDLNDYENVRNDRPPPSPVRSSPGREPVRSPVRSPPRSPMRESRSSSPELETPARHAKTDTDLFDPFADDNEQLERPKHTPLW